MTAETKFRWAIVGLLALTIASALLTAIAADYTRDGGTANWMCCSDKACATIISQHSDPVYAVKACEALTDKDGVTRYVRSNAFRITAPPPVATGSATLHWTPPTQNTDGSALTNLAGYRIIYGTSESALTQSIQVASASLSSYVVEGLAPGPWYFAVRSYNAAGVESATSSIASKVVP